MQSELINDLIYRAGWTPLPHRSAECYPCVNANRNDFLALDEFGVERVAQLEAEMSQGRDKPRFMFRPQRFKGARGIREVLKWAQAGHGKYRPPACDSGMCGG